MMGRNHLLSGLAVGLAVSPLVAADTIHHAAWFGVVTACYAIVPDLDHGSSTASRSLGFITGWSSAALRKLSEVAYQRTRGTGDHEQHGTHRHLSHTVLFALLLGGLVGLLSLVAPFTGVVATVFGLAVAGKIIGQWGVLAALSALTVVATTAPDENPTLFAVQIGVAVALGCITHDVGDSLTRSGCPLIWPIRIGTKRWYDVRPLGPASFYTNGTVENALVAPALVILTGVALWMHAAPYAQVVLHQASP